MASVASQSGTVASASAVPSWVLGQLRNNSVLFQGARFNVTVPFPTAGYAHSTTALLAANALATQTETLLSPADSSVTTFLDAAISTFMYVLSTQWDTGFIPHVSFNASGQTSSSDYVNDVPSPKTWDCTQLTSSLAALPIHASTALKIFAWANQNNTAQAYNEGLGFLGNVVDPLDRWHSYLVASRSVPAGGVVGSSSALAGADDDASAGADAGDDAAAGGAGASAPALAPAPRPAPLDGLLYIVHPWESVDPYAQLWADLLPPPAAACVAALPAAVTQSPFWGSPTAYCQAQELLARLQFAGREQRQQQQQQQQRQKHRATVRALRRLFWRREAPSLQQQQQQLLLLLRCCSRHTRSLL
jgi:hypothetical protein